uniref:DEP domain-containing protein 1B isoform X4 n=1 Tax=Geotrypetes seraphini TaxID=260995 RepID=A0A6P8PBX8_GEOSA|nr:DEP domain-containing protein 1B isoform X4 [Geotrypetes seraphini]
MEHKIIGPGPYRATKLWNEIIELFRAGMSLRKHRVHFRSYDKCFSASEAIEYLHDLLRCNQNFGPDVSHSQTIQLLKKFLKNHVIEDVKGRWGTEDFEDNGCLYSLQKILGLDSLNDVLDAKLVNPKHIMHSVYSTNKQGVVILEDKSEELPHWVLSAMKCLANWPNCSDLKQPMYVGFEKDVFKTVADYHSYLKEPLLTYQLFDAFVNVLALSGFVSLPVQSAQKENSQQFPLHIQQHSSENEKRNLVLSSSMSIESLMLSLSRKQRKPDYPDVIPKLLERSDLDMNCMKTRDERDLTTISQYFLSSNSTQFIPYFNQEQSNKHSIYQPSLQQCASFNMRKASVLFSEDNIYHGGSLQNLRGFRDEFLNPWVSTYRLSSLEALPDVGKLEKKHLFPHFASVDNFAFEQEHMRYTSVGKQNRSQSVHYLPTLHEISMPTHDALLSNCQSCNDAYCPGFMSLVSLKEDEESIQGNCQLLENKNGGRIYYLSASSF